MSLSGRFLHGIAVEVSHELRRGSRTSEASHVGKLADLLLLLVGEGDLEGTPVLLEVLHLLGAGDGDDVLALLEEPGQGELGDGAVLAGGEAPELLDQLDVGVHVLALEARHVLRAGVAAGVLGRARAEVVGQDAAAERGRGDDGHAELAAGGQEVAAGRTLDLAREDGVVGLDGGDLGYLAGPAESGGADSGDANVLDLAFPVKNAGLSVVCFWIGVRSYIALGRGLCGCWNILLQLHHGTHRLLDGGLWVGVVQPVWHQAWLAHVGDEKGVMS